MNSADSKTLIFVETKRKADDITKNMRRDGWPALCIHGDKAQGERDWVLNGRHHLFVLALHLKNIITSLDLCRIQNWQDPNFDSY